MRVLLYLVTKHDRKNEDFCCNCDHLDNYFTFAPSSFKEHSKSVMFFLNNTTELSVTSSRLDMATTSMSFNSEINCFASFSSTMFPHVCGQHVNSMQGDLFFH